MQYLSQRLLHEPSLSPTRTNVEHSRVRTLRRRSASQTNLTSSLISFRGKSHSLVRQLQLQRMLVRDRGLERERKRLSSHWCVSIHLRREGRLTAASKKQGTISRDEQQGDAQDNPGLDQVRMLDSRSTVCIHLTRHIATTNHDASTWTSSRPQRTSLTYEIDTFLDPITFSIFAFGVVPRNVRT